MRIELIATLDDIRGDADILARMNRLMREHEGYRHLTDAHGRAFATYEAFCLERRPFGLGYDPRDIEAIITERRSAKAHAQLALPEPKQEHGKGKAGPGRGHKTVRDANRFKVSTMDADYLTRRIARDRPDILERMRAGEFRSVRAAAREAGLVRREIRIPLAPERAARLLAKHFDAAELDQVIALLVEARNGGGG